MVSKDEMKRLRGELKTAGVFEHHSQASWQKLALMLAVTLGCCAGVAFGPSGAWNWTWFVLVPLAALATTTATLIGHEGGHGSFAKRGADNQLLVYITLPLFAGISALYWKHKHNGLHHGHPNVVGSDPDIELWPMASSRAEYERAGPVLRWFQRNTQGYLFWPASSTLSTMMRLPSYSFVYRQLRTRGAVRAVVADAACLVAHYALWVGLPSLYFGFLPVFALYMTIWALVGVMLAVIFSPAHLGLPLLVDQHHDWRHQLETTRNIRVPRWLSYFYVGLDYQIEHHIFPQIPHQNLPRASAIMRRWCAEVGLPHREVDYVAALVSVTVFVRDAWKLDAAMSTPTQRPSFGEAAREPRSFGARALSLAPAKPSTMEALCEQSIDTSAELATDLVC